MVKIGIYDRYLSTYGGGERYSCKAAEILSKQKNYRVELLTDLYVNIGQLSDRLNLDLSRVSLKIFPFISEEYAKEITRGYDIFINATYLSPLPAYGKRNIYICYFPTPFDVDFKFIHKFLLLFRLPVMWLFRVAGKLSNGFRGVEAEKGLYDPKRFLLGRGSWTSGEVLLKYEPGEDIRVGLKNPHTSKLDTVEATVEAGCSGRDKFFKKKLAIAKGQKKTIDIGRAENLTFVNIISPTFKPEGDTRRLGIALYDLRPANIAKKLLLKALGFIPLFLVTYPKDLSFLNCYHDIISISEYSRRWIKKYWRRDSKLLFPPVDIENFKASEKEKTILSVGRFFPEHHNKKQLELARAFKQLVDGYPEIMGGYRLCLAGGVSDKESHLQYVEKVREESAGYPIEILTNVDWKDLVNIFSKSSIFWHASGMGEDEGKHPEKFEHFGITTVEAMASGCIPIVINKGGQKEIIENGENGFLFSSIEGLKEITIKVCSGEINGEKIKENAIKGATKFSSDNFSRRLLEIIGEG